MLFFANQALGVSWERYRSLCHIVEGWNVALWGVSKVCGGLELAILTLPAASASAPGVTLNWVRVCCDDGIVHVV